MNSPKLSDKHQRMQVQGKRQKHTQHRQSTQIEPSDEEIESSPCTRESWKDSSGHQLAKSLKIMSQILERVKSDRVTVTKPEEDRRRRTIIVEKKNGSYGFTLQSYGIHYKKEQEIEMITYVDYVDYDGPAYRAGMREGDVILSINGNDMEKADHKTLVNFIKNCDSRMRMVVLFEDCVRKVELHIRYIHLQRILQNKMNELEKLCIRERQLLEGKWKTHSLPARKKASAPNDSNAPTPQAIYSHCRPTLSTEDIVKPNETPPTLMLAYQYLDPHYRAYVLQPPPNNSGEYLFSFCPPRCHAIDQHHFIVKTPCDNTRSNKNCQTNGVLSPTSNHSNKTDKKQESRHSAGHLCNPCMKANSNQDSTSLEAYDLASPCCDPHCVPSARRRSRNHKDHHSKRECQASEVPDDVVDNRSHYIQRNKSQPIASSQLVSVPVHPTPRHRYLSFGAGLVSQCSLHSCTSSEFSNTQVAGIAESSAASYTTSLSTDTLYWDAPPPGEFNASGRPHNKPLVVKQHTYHHQQQYYPPTTQAVEGDHLQYSQYHPAKPKSWDNLTTKAFGGYGFGYGYLDTSAKNNKGHTRTQSTKGAIVANQPIGGQHSKSGNDRHQDQHAIYGQRTGKRYVHPTKSTESLLGLPKFDAEQALSDSSLSCECLDVTTPEAAAHGSQFFAGNVTSPADSRNTYYSRRNSRVDAQDNIVSTSTEITRL